MISTDFKLYIEEDSEKNEEKKESNKDGVDLLPDLAKKF